MSTGAAKGGRNNWRGGHSALLPHRPALSGGGRVSRRRRAGRGDEELRERSGNWFDPALVSAFEALADDAFWQGLADPALAERVFAHPAGQGRWRWMRIIWMRLRRPSARWWTPRAPIPRGTAAGWRSIPTSSPPRWGCPRPRRRWLKRGALLHDVGKLGVSNAILDKPGKLDEQEWAAVQMHAAYTERS